MFLVSMQQILRIRHLSLELVEVVTRVVDWPAEKEDVHIKKKIYIYIYIYIKRMHASCLLVHNLNPRGLTFFFPDLHTDVSRS